MYTEKRKRRLQHVKQTRMEAETTSIGRTTAKHTTHTRQLHHSTERKEDRGAVASEAARPTAPSLHTSGTAQHGCYGKHTPHPRARAVREEARAIHTHTQGNQTKQVPLTANLPALSPGPHATKHPTRSTTAPSRYRFPPRGPNRLHCPRTGHPASLLTADRPSLRTAPAAYPTTSP